MRHDVEGEGVDQARARDRPDHGAEGREKQLHEDTDGPHEHALAGLPEGPARGRVHVGQRHEHQEHDAEDVDVAAIALDDEGVTELVEDLHAGQAQIEKTEIRRCEQALGLICQPRSADEREDRTEQHHDGPDRHHRARGGEMHQRADAIEPVVRVPERDANVQEAEAGGRAARAAGTRGSDRRSRSCRACCRSRGGSSGGAARGPPSRPPDRGHVRGGAPRIPARRRRRCASDRGGR